MRTKIQCVNDNVRLSQWKQIIQNCRDSGLPVKRWCDENNISEPSYYYYLKKFRELAIKEADDHQDFYPIVVNDYFSRSAPLIHSLSTISKYSIYG